MTLATKAARGAGAPPGQAADFGRAAVQYLMERKPESALIAALEALPAGPITAVPVALARRVEDPDMGVALSDPLGLLLSYVAAHPLLEGHKGDDGAVTVDLRTEPKTVRPVARVEVSQGLVDHLQSLAAKTFVPESAASRAAGAGSGLSDND
ncbi:MAG: hypothetical protein AAF307_01985 [Pseudomonadota bacterium]